MYAMVAQAASEHNILVPPLYDIVWSTITLLLIVVPMYFFVLPKLNGVLDERSKRIEDGIAAAERAKETEALAKRQAEERLAQANAEAGRIRSEASEDGKRIVAKARKDAEAEAELILKNAKRQMHAQRQAAEISLRTEVGLLATELAEKIVGEHLKDRELTARVVDRFLDDLESQDDEILSGSVVASDADSTEAH